MTYLLVAFLLSLTFSLFLSSWRVGILGLGFQAILVGVLLAKEPEPLTWFSAFPLLDAVLFRGVLVPIT
jgi:hypothetical protein